jgi:kynurenine formamidase
MNNPLTNSNFYNIYKITNMNIKANRRDFLNKSLKVGAFMLLPCDGFSNGKSKGVQFSNQKDILMRRAPLSTEDYIAYATRFSNWGRWGNDDQFGTLNFIDEDKRKEAVKLVRLGNPISCGRALNTKEEPENIRPALFNVTLHDTGRTWAEGTITLALDYMAVQSHGFVETHIDALNHVHTNDRRMYNGRPISDVKPTGVESDSIDIWKDGIISRGVFYDIPKLRGTRCVTPDKPVQGWELEDYALKYNIEPKPGDIVIIDCGREKYYIDHPDASRKQGEKPGLDPSVLEFYYKYNASVLGCDFDEAPVNKTYNTNVPLHAIANPHMGLPTLWNLDLNRLRDKCVEFDRHDFLFIINPLIIPGGTASVVNPVAIF